MKGHLTQKRYKVILVFAVFAFLFNCCFAQSKDKIMRIVELEIDSITLKIFNAALKEDIETAVRVEPGVLTLFAVYDKTRPTHVTIFEVYSSEEAHRLHQQSPHFLKYRRVTEGMVKSARRQDVLPIALEAKQKM